MSHSKTAVALAGAAVVLGALWDSGHSSPGRSETTVEKRFAVADLPLPKRPAFTPDRPTPLRRDETRARFASVLRALNAHMSPNETSPVVARVPRKTPEGTTNIVLVLGETQGRRQWVRVRIADLPTNRTAWVRRRDLGGYVFRHTRLVVDRDRLTAILFRDGRPVFRASIGVGTQASPTPAGNFYVRDKLAGFGDPFYGPVAFGTSARSPVLTDWPGGGFVGIHGTDEPGLIPGRISHGCIRMRNADIQRLSRLMRVGTPLTIK